MLAALVLVLLCVQSALGQVSPPERPDGVVESSCQTNVLHPQVCSPGFAFDEAIGECRGRRLSLPPGDALKRSDAQMWSLSAFQM